MDKKKVANNILEFLLDPTAIPIRQRLYFRPEERLDNLVYDKAKLDAMKAYGDQRHNADMYPIRNRTLTQREDLRMDRRTLVASLDILSQNFTKDDPIARDLRTMAYAVSKMSDEELSERLAEEAPDFTSVEAKRKVKTFKCPECGTKVLEQTGYCVKCKKKVKEAAEEIGEGDSAVSENAEEGTQKKEASFIDGWNDVAANAVAKAIVADVKGTSACKDMEEPDKVSEEESDEAPAEESVAKPAPAAKQSPAKNAGKIKGPGVPDATGPASETGQCPLKKEEKKSMVNTDILAMDLNPSESVEIDGVQFASQTISADQVGMTDEEKNNLEAVFGFSLDLTNEEKDRYNQLYR